MVNKKLNNDLHILFKALKRVRNKFFFNRLSIGVLNFFSFLLIYIIVIFLADYSFHFSGYSVIFFRYVFYSYSLFLFLYFIGKDFYNWLFNYRKYSYKYFANLIGNAVPEIDDKIINILELNELSSDNSLIEYSIFTKLNGIKFSSFKTIFSFKLLLYHLIFTFSIISISFLFYSSSPQNFKYSKSRLLGFNQNHTVSPYTVKLVDYKDYVYKGSDYNIQCIVEGNFTPDKVYFEIGDEKILMVDSLNFFLHTIENIQSDFEFRIITDEYTSSTYKINCIPVPIIRDININIIPPKYTDIKPYNIKSVGNFMFPFGSIISWDLSVFDADSVFVLLDSTFRFEQNKSNFIFRKQLFKSYNYSILLKNKQNDSVYKFNFSAKVLDDKFPKFEDNHFDSDFIGNFTCHGTISDDYGFHSLLLCFKQGDSLITQNIPFEPNSTNQEYFYSGTFKDYLNFSHKGSLSVFYKVFDNDPFYPYKCSSSSVQLITIPDKATLAKAEDSTITNLRQQLDMTAQMFKAIKKNEFDIQKKLVAETLSSWDKELLVNDLKNSQKDLKKLKSSINKLQNKLQKLQAANKSDKLIDKQKKINDLLNKLMDKDIKNMLEELEKLQKEINSKNSNKLDLKKFSFEEANKELQRSLELLKKYELEKKLEDLVGKLKQIKKDYNPNNNDKKLNLDSLNTELRKSLAQHDSILNKNKSLSSPLKLNDFAEQKSGIKSKLNNLKGNSDKSTKQKISDDIDKLARDIENDFKNSAFQQEGEDEELLTLILHNLLLLSYEQESLIQQFDGVDYIHNNSLKENQLHIKNQFQVIRDSLYSIAQRNFSVSTFIIDNIRDINVQLSNIKAKFVQDRVISVQVQQQMVLKAFNELILVISESLEHMDSQSNSSGGGCGKAKKNKKKGSNGKPKVGQSLKEQLQQMINDLKKSKKAGNSKGQGQKLMQMLGQQEMMQQTIQDILKNYNLNSDSKKLFNQIEKSIDQNIDDILNKNINENLVNRQKKILTKLLESDKALMERDKDKNRQAEKPNNYKISNPKGNLEYKDNVKLHKGLLYKHAIKLNYFFQRIYENYSYKLENE